MTYDLTGRVAAVNTVPLGSTLALDPVANSGEIFVEETSDFDPNGGFVRFEDGTVVAHYEVDDETGRIVLDEGPFAGLFAGDRVEVCDEAGNVVVETLAEIVEEGDEENADTLEAIVDHALIPFLPEGIREAWNGTVGEAVALQWRGEDLYVVNIIGQEARFDGAAIDPETTIPPAALTDGLAPATSPTPVLVQGIGSVHVMWTPVPNADPVTYKVYAGTAPGFPKDATTFVGSAAGQGPVTVRALADGTRLTYSIDPTTGLPVPYYFAIIATDADGPGPVGAEASSNPALVNADDLATNSVTTDALASNSVTTDQLAAGSVTSEHFVSDLILGTKITASERDEAGLPIGRRVEIDPSGIVLLDSTGQPVVSLPTEEGTPASFRGQVETDSLRVLGGTSIESATNEIAKDGALTLSAGVSTPILAPTLAVQYETTRLDTTTKYTPETVWGGLPSGGYGSIALDPAKITSFGWHAAWGVWVVVTQQSGGVRFWMIDPATGKPAKNLASGKDWIEDNGGWDLVRNAWQHDPTQISTNVWGRIGSNWWASIRRPNGTMGFNLYPASHRLNSTQDPVMGHDGTYYIVAENDNAGSADEVLIRRYNAVNTDNGNLSQQSTIRLATGTAMGHPLACVLVGAFDYANGTKVFFPTRDGYTTAQMSSYAAGAASDVNRRFSMGRTVKGFGWDGSAFWSVGSDGVLFRYGSWTWTDGLDYLHLAYSLFDSDVAGDTASPHPGQTAGQHETMIGTRAYLSMPKRAKLLVTVPTVPDKGGADDPDKIRLYAVRTSTSTAPANSSYRLQWEGGSASAPTGVTLTGYSTTGTAPAPSNNFPGANPATLRSQTTETSGSRKFEVKGDGTGRWSYVQPPGAITMYGGTAAPAGWLLCNGQAVSRTAYADLYAAIGTAFGAGDGSTTFNVPNFATGERFPKGPTATRPVGSTGGSMKISTSQLPAHSHSISIQYATTTSTGGTATRVTDVENTTGGTGTGATATGNATGSGSDYLPPYLTVSFLIKT